MNNKANELTFKQSVKPDFLKICLSILLIMILLIISNKNIFDFNMISIDLTKFLDVERTELNRNFTSLYILISLIIFYDLFKLLQICYIKISHRYHKKSLTIEEEKGIIFKSLDSIPLRNIKLVNVETPNILQLITGVRTLRIEADGMEGMDMFLKNISEYEHIKELLLLQLRGN